MNHFTTPSFWELYQKLPVEIQTAADKNFQLLKGDIHHPSLHFKKVGNYCSVRIGKRYRAISVEIDDGLLWFWIGTHAEYDKII